VSDVFGTPASCLTHWHLHYCVKRYEWNARRTAVFSDFGGQNGFHDQRKRSAVLPMWAITGKQIWKWKQSDLPEYQIRYLNDRGYDGHRGAQEVG
jgi:hypothetical protein